MHAVVLVTGLVVASLCSTSALSGSFSSRRLQAPATCVLTPSDVEGPYYLPGVPLRSAQAHYCPPVTTKPFTNLSIAGTVSSALNKCKKLANATIEIWQANNAGAYDVSPANVLTSWCRTKVATNRNGAWSVNSVMPARYGSGCQRPAHVHFKISAKGYSTLVTQMYFKGENEGVCGCLGCDNPLQQVKVSKAGKATFNIVLKPLSS